MTPTFFYILFELQNNYDDSCCVTSFVEEQWSVRFPTAPGAGYAIAIQVPAFQSQDFYCLFPFKSFCVFISYSKYELLPGLDSNAEWGLCSVPSNQGRTLLLCGKNESTCDFQYVFMSGI